MVPGPNPQTAAAAPTPPILVRQGVTVVNPGAKTGGDRAQEMTGQGPKEEEEEDEDNATSGITPTPGPTHPAETNPRVEDNQPRTGSAGKLTSGEMRHSPRPQPLQDKVSTIRIILKILVLWQIFKPRELGPIFRRQPQSKLLPPDLARLEPHPKDRKFILRLEQLVPVKIPRYLSL